MWGIGCSYPWSFSHGVWELRIVYRNFYESPTHLQLPPADCSLQSEILLRTLCPETGAFPAWGVVWWVLCWGLVLVRGFLWRCLPRAALIAAVALGSPLRGETVLRAVSSCSRGLVPPLVTAEGNISAMRQERAWGYFTNTRHGAFSGISKTR